MTTWIDQLPARVAHATHALMESSGAYAYGTGPRTAREACEYDAPWEALTPRHTAAALREAARRGLVAYVPRGLWMPTNVAYAHRNALEARYLRDDDANRPAPEPSLRPRLLPRGPFATVTLTGI